MLSLMLMLLAPGQTAADPLAPAREGKMQCVAPNREKKTCLAIARFTLGPGGYESDVTVMINPTPMMTMATHSKGTVEDGKTCTLVLAEDYAAARLEMNGAPMDAATADALRPQIAAAVAPMVGKKGCSQEHAEGDLIVSEVTLDGVARPDMTQKLIWVSPEEGYKVGAP